MTALIAPFALAGGTWIFLGVVVALFFAVVFGYYTRTGSGISQRPYRRPDAPSEQPSELAHDVTQDVRRWERGTEGHHRARRSATPPTTDLAVAQALADWRKHRAAEDPVTTSAVAAEDRVRGPASAPPVVLWIDASNEPCRSAYRLLSQFADAHRLRLAVRQLPLADVHPLALAAAEALEAAAGQGGFFTLLDSIAATAASDEDDLMSRAGAAVPDAQRLREEIQDGRHRAAVVEQIRQASASAVPAVPAVYINGTHYNGSIKRDEFSRALLEAHPPDGVPAPPPRRPPPPQ